MVTPFHSPCRIRVLPPNLTHIFLVIDCPRTDRLRTSSIAPHWTIQCYTTEVQNWESNESENNSKLIGSHIIPIPKQLHQTLVVGHEGNSAANDESAHAVTCDRSLNLSHQEPRRVCRMTRSLVHLSLVTSLPHALTLLESSHEKICAAPTRHRSPSQVTSPCTQYIWRGSSPSWQGLHFKQLNILVKY